MMNSEHYDVAIVGAGPAGIMAAIFAAKTGAQVALFEKNEKIGRKILATGNGRCNLTNRNITLNRYHGNDVSFVAPILANFDQLETMKFFESIGVLLKQEDSGRIFPRTNQASSVVDALEAQLISKNVGIFTNFTVKKIEPGKHWQITSENSQKITANRLILATGGKAAHMFGSSGDGLFWAHNFGHTIIPIHAALVPLETVEESVQDIMGIKLFSQVRLLADTKEIARREGDIIFTHFGLSGPAVMGLAREVGPLLSANKKVEIAIDAAPELSADRLDEIIIDLAKANGGKSIKSLLAGLLPKNLIPHILTATKIDENTKAAEISRKERHTIINTLKNFCFTIKKVRPLKEAQVTAGGIATSEVTLNLESKIIPGLYFAGEILDIDGDSGGFNLQWAWSSGKVAGEAAARSISGIN